MHGPSLSLCVNHSKKKLKFSTTEHVYDFHIHSSAELLKNSFAILDSFIAFLPYVHLKEKKVICLRIAILICQFQEDIHLYHCE